MKKAVVITGIVVGLFALYNAKQKKNNNPKIYFLKKMGGNYNGRTVPPFGIYILESQKDNQELINHELIHWKQYQRMGLINFHLEFAKQLYQYGYDKAPLEIEARANESDYCKTNYIECVRTGKAKTVFNPNFLL